MCRGTCLGGTEGVGGGPSQCVSCLQTNLDKIVKAGTCPAPGGGVQADDDETPGLSPLVVHVYCM